MIHCQIFVCTEILIDVSIVLEVFHHKRDKWKVNISSHENHKNKVHNFFDSKVQKRVFQTLRNWHSETNLKLTLFLDCWMCQVVYKKGL